MILPVCIMLKMLPDCLRTGELTSNKWIRKALDDTMLASSYDLLQYPLLCVHACVKEEQFLRHYHEHLN